MGLEMQNMPKLLDYERLTLAELSAAAVAPSLEQRRVHLDQASVFATLSERSKNLAVVAG
jgi:ferric-dicitrate binding protein FerR (iron transport regulator)